MSSDNTIILYLKAERHTLAKRYKVKLSDVAEVECTDKHLEKKIKDIVILQIPSEAYHRYVISILNIMQKIYAKYPEIDIRNVGETDLIITYEPQKKNIPLLEYGKVALIAAITFTGSAFAAMTFNNDISLTQLFAQLYEWVMGRPSDGFSLLEFSYSIGVIAGILLFFQHFGGKRFTVDPTPIEVEMRTYESDIQMTIVENYARKEQEIHVDSNDASGSAGI